MRWRPSAANRTKEFWIESAAERNATHLITGSLQVSNGKMQLHAILEDLSGERLLEIDLPVTRDPFSSARLFGAKVREGLGLAQQTEERSRHPFEDERDLELGISSLEQARLTEASLLLIPLSGRSAEADYYLAHIGLWEKNAISSKTHIERALAGDLTRLQKSVMKVLRFFVDHNYPEALAHFEDLYRVHGQKRDVLFGLFEASYHRGRPGDAARWHRALSEVAPRLKLGLEHPLAYAVSQGDREEMDRLMALIDDRLVAPWTLHGLISQRRYEEAKHFLVNEFKFRPARILAWRRVNHAALLALMDRWDDAEARMRDADAGIATHSRWGLAVARGDRPASRAALAKVVEQLEQPADKLDRRELNYAVGPLIGETGVARISALAALLASNMGEPSSYSKDVILRNIESVAPADSEEYRVHGLRVLVAGLLDEPGLLDERQRSYTPGARAMSRAFEAHRRGNYEREATLWQTAIRFDADGRFLTLKNYLPARAHRSAENWDGVIDACYEATHPRALSDWGWTSLVAPCLVWSGEAATRLGKTEAAHGHYERLLKIRDRASNDDPFVSTARLALAEL